MPELNLQRDVGRIEGKLDAVLSALNRHNGLYDSVVDRLNKVENKQYWLSGATALACGIIAVVVRLYG